MQDQWQTISPLSAQMFSESVIGGGFDDPAAFHRGLQKALSSSATIDTNLTDSAGTAITALRLEDLSGILTILTHKAEHLNFWRWLKKGGAFNVTYQWNRIDSYGEDEASPFYLEGGKPIPADDIYVRKTRDIKYLGVEREITLAAMLQRTGGGVPDIKTQTTKTGTLLLLQKLEKALFYSRAELDTSGYAFDGLEQQMIDECPSENVIDCLGKTLRPSLLDDGTKILSDNYSTMSDINCFMSNDTVTNFAKPYHGSSYERILMNATKDGVILAGNVIDGYKSQFGFVPFSPNVFMGKYRERMKLSDFITARGGTNAPNAIPAGSILVDLLVNANSKLAAGTYYYTITAKNRYGTSTPVHIASGIAIGAGVQMTVKWTAPVATPAGGAPTSYLIWRHDEDPSVTANQPDVKLMREVTASGTLEYVDVNQWRPGTGVTFLLDGEMESLCAVQLSPLMRFPLAVVTTAYRYLLLLFVDLAVRNARKQVMFKNVGSDST